MSPTVFLIVLACAGVLLLVIGICIGTCIGPLHPEPRHAIPRLEPIRLQRTLPALDAAAERHVAAMRPEVPFDWAGIADPPPSPRHATAKAVTDTGWHRALRERADEFIYHRIPELAAGKHEARP